MESSSTIASRYRVGKRDREAFVGCCAIPRSSRWRFRDLGGSETYDKRERERRRREEREGRKDDCHPRAGERMRKRGGGGGSGDVLAKVTAGNAVCVRRSKVVCRVAELASSFSFFASLALSLSLSSVVRLAASPALTVGAQRRRLQECTKCIALTGVRPVPPASTCLLRTRSRAHACSSPVPWRSSSPPPSTLPCRALLPPRFTRTRTEKE